MADTIVEAHRDGETRDLFYGGRLMIRQPAKGHRSGTDAILLAAAVRRGFAGLAYDVGAGVGVAGLGIALAHPSARVRLIENDPATADLAEANISAAGMAERVTVARCDALSSADRRPLAGLAQLVVTNPPFHAAGRVRVSPDPGRRAAHVMTASVTEWVLACLDGLDAKGTLIVVHAPEAVPELLSALDRRAGAVTILAVHPRAGTPARRVLLRATKGSRAPFTIAAPLVLHEDQGFTVEAARLHRGEGGLDWWP